MPSNQYMMCVEDVAKELDCSKSYAYKIVKTLNKELAEQGYITIYKNEKSECSHSMTAFAF